MANFFFGTLKPEDLQRKGFTHPIHNSTLSQCYALANQRWNDRKNRAFGAMSFAFLPDNNQVFPNPPFTTKDADRNFWRLRGKCTFGPSNYKPTDYAGNIPGVYRIYDPTQDCISESCLRERGVSVLKRHISIARNTPGVRNSLIQKLEARLRSAQHKPWGRNDDFVSSSINSGNTNINSRNTNSNEREEMERRHREQLAQIENNKRKQREEIERLRREQLAQYQNLLNNIRLYHKSEKQNLSNKNRLIAETSSNIQISTDKLEELNNKINEANQEIAKNNVDFEKKNNIITTLRAMITIFFILLLVMIVYYGALYTRDTYPETYNSITNSISNSFSNFSSFNTNY